MGSEGLCLADQRPKGRSIKHIISEKRGITLAQGTSTWWEFVASFSEGFAEFAEGEYFLLSRVPYQETAGNIWEESELPALKANPRVTRVICVDLRKTPIEICPAARILRLALCHKNTDCSFWEVLGMFWGKQRKLWGKQRKDRILNLVSNMGAHVKTGLLNKNYC